MRILLRFVILISILSMISLKSDAQLDSVMSECKSFLDKNYISDGQQYMSLITGDQTAEFSVIFYGGNTYRVIICGGNENSELMFSLYDKYRNELFKSSDFNNTNYWDFQFESTVECFIEARFSKNINISGFAVILVGLKK